MHPYLCSHFALSSGAVSKAKDKLLQMIHFTVERLANQPSVNYFSSHQPSVNDFSSHQSSANDFSSHQPSENDFSSHQPSVNDFSSHQPSENDFSSHQPSENDFSSHQPSEDDVSINETSTYRQVQRDGLVHRERGGLGTMSQRGAVDQRSRLSMHM